MSNPLYLTEADVGRLVTVKDAIDVLRETFKAWRAPGTTNLPRQRARLGGGTLNLMGAASDPMGIFGLKVYFAGKAGARYHALLYAADGSGLLAMIEADLLGALRTGAASGLATDLLARPDARTLGVIGSGKQARTQVAAVCAVRRIERIRVFSPSRERRTAFAFWAADALGVETEPVDTGEACVGGADVVITITKARDPVLRSAWVADGVHINAAGANAGDRCELDLDTVLRARVRVTDDRTQAKIEAGEFLALAADGRLAWDDVVELGDLVAGRSAGRTSRRDITLFKSLGIALEDIAFAQEIHRRAVEQGVGRPMPG
jgi:ornithine cyclodeaminase/alanine dehydrogenase